MKNEDRDVCLKAQPLVIDIVGAIVSSNDGSHDTLKIDSSLDKQNSNEVDNNFRSTEKLNENEDEYLQDEEEALIPRKIGRNEDLYQTRNSAKDIGNHYYNSSIMLLNKTLIPEYTTTKMEECEKIEATQVDDKSNERQADGGFTMLITTVSLDYMIHEDETMIHEDDREDAKSKFDLENLAQSHMLCTDGIEHFVSLRISQDDGNEEFTGFSNVEVRKKVLELGIYGLNTTEAHGVAKAQMENSSNLRTLDCLKNKKKLKIESSKGKTLTCNRLDLLPDLAYLYKG